MPRILSVFLLIGLPAMAQLNFPKDSSRVQLPNNELAIQMERQSGDLRVLSAKIEGMQQNTSASLQRMETDLQKNRDQHQDFERRIDELHADFRIYPWLFTALGCLLMYAGQHIFGRWLKKKFPDDHQPQNAAPAS